MEEGEIASDGEILPEAPAEDSPAAEAPEREEAPVPVEESAGKSYYCPVLNLDPPAQRIFHLHRQFHSGKVANNFFKGVKWSPDGSCFLTCSDDKSLRLFDLPSNALEVDSTVASSDDQDPLQASLTTYEGETVYDFCWYPHMVATDVATCVFATTSRDHPVHLWDAATGKLRCTYRAYDAVDEITAALAVAFDPTGSRLFCGYYKKLRIFDTSRPGRLYEEHSTITSSKEGITGIISALAFNGRHPSLLAAGSYDRSIALYDEASMDLLYTLHGHEGGITQVQFSKDGNYLYSGGRKDPYIFCWDVRFTTEAVYKLERAVTNTNQRVSFDIEPYGKLLGTGGEDGQVRFFDLQTGHRAGSMTAASDTINGFAFHPSYPLAVSTSGQRRFFESADDGDAEQILKPERITDAENCASLWRFSCSWAEIKLD